MKIITLDLACSIIEELTGLPSSPAHPVFGAGCARVAFPNPDPATPHSAQTRFWSRIWTGVPSRHKVIIGNGMWISPEAFQVIQKHL